MHFSSQAFSAELSNEVDLGQLSEQLVAMVSETMQPAFVSLWLCQSAPRNRAGSRLSNVSSRTTTLETKQSRDASWDATNIIESVGLVKENPYG